MSLGFISSTRRGQHFELAKFAVNKLKSANLKLKGKSEREYEQAIIGHLQSSPRLRNNLITQVGSDEVEKITQAKLFGFSHRPDASIGNDGTAIEIKVVSGGQATRDILGQSIAYRMQYRYVILVIVDTTSDGRIIELCLDKKSQEHSLFTGMADKMNVFSVIGPLSQSKNKVFLP